MVAPSIESTLFIGHTSNKLLRVHTSLPKTTGSQCSGFGCRRVGVASASSARVSQIYRVCGVPQFPEGFPGYITCAESRADRTHGKEEVFGTCVLKERSFQWVVGMGPINVAHPPETAQSLTLRRTVCLGPVFQVSANFHGSISSGDSCTQGALARPIFGYRNHRRPTPSGPTQQPQTKCARVRDRWIFQVNQETGHTDKISESGSPTNLHQRF